MNKTYFIVGLCLFSSFPLICMNEPDKFIQVKIRTYEDLEKIGNLKDDEVADFSEFDSSQLAPEYLEMVRFLAGTIDNTKRARIPSKSKRKHRTSR